MIYTRRADRLNSEGKKNFKFLYENDKRNFIYLHSGQPD